MIYFRCFHLNVLYRTTAERSFIYGMIYMIYDYLNAIYLQCYVRVEFVELSFACVVCSICVICSVFDLCCFQLITFTHTIYLSYVEVEILFGW